MKKVLNEETTPYDNPDIDIGLMTKEEFLDHRNPDKKIHDSEAYKTDIRKLNFDFSLSTAATWPLDNDNKLIYEKNENGFFISKVDLRMNTQDLVAVFHNGTLYHIKDVSPKKIPTDLPSIRRNGDRVELDVKNYEMVKYISEYAHLVSDTAKRNKDAYPHLFNRIKISDQYFEIRANDEVKKENINEIDIKILNEKGLVVGMAASEWGATLIQVADEYKGYGLGKILGKIFYEYNPKRGSGGFTPSGLRNAIKIWQDRVRKMFANGWYTTLIDQGVITKERVKEIVNSVGEKISDPRQEKSDKTNDKNKQPEPIVFIDEDDISFVVYDIKFYEEQKEDYIYGFGFFRDYEDKTILYRIDYERSYHQLTSYVALQIAKNNNELLYIDNTSPSAVTEFEKLNHVYIDDGYAILEKDVLDIKKMKRIEKQYRKKYDKYDEVWHQLVEMAEAKW